MKQPAACGLPRIAEGLDRELIEFGEFTDFFDLVEQALGKSIEL